MLMTLLHFPELLPNTNAFLQIISSENIHQCFIYILIFFLLQVHPKCIHPALQVEQVKCDLDKAKPDGKVRFQ